MRPHATILESRALWWPVTEAGGHQVSVIGAISMVDAPGWPLTYNINKFIWIYISTFSPNLLVFQPLSFHVHDPIAKSFSVFYQVINLLNSGHFPHTKWMVHPVWSSGHCKDFPMTDFHSHPWVMITCISRFSFKFILSWCYLWSQSDLFFPPSSEF